MECKEQQYGNDIRTGFIELPSGRKQIKYSVVDGLAIFEGDIVLCNSKEMETAGEIDFAVVITGDQFRWHDGIIPYTIDPNLNNQERINIAIAHWQERTCIKFVPRSSEPNFVHFRPANGCMSSVGMIGGQQDIGLANGCDTGRVIHEIGHAVGLFHEQSREDRDNFVKILWENIEAGKEFNFDKHITDADDYGPYDYRSIMHYERYAFSKNGQPTIEPIQSGVNIGQRIGLSDGDVAAVNAMYQCILKHNIEPNSVAVSRTSDS